MGFGGIALAHFGADIIAPIFSSYNETSGGSQDAMGLSSLTSGFFLAHSDSYHSRTSFYPSPKLRELEGAGASKIGTVFIYVLVASIVMKMNIGEVLSNLGAFAIGLVWMAIHVGLLLGVGKLIKAPFFFYCSGESGKLSGALLQPRLLLQPLVQPWHLLGYSWQYWDMHWEHMEPLFAPSLWNVFPDNNNALPWLFIHPQE